MILYKGWAGCDYDSQPDNWHFTSQNIYTTAIYSEDSQTIVCPCWVDQWKKRLTWLSYMQSSWDETCSNQLCLEKCLLYLKFRVMDAQESSYTENFILYGWHTFDTGIPNEWSTLCERIYYNPALQVWMCKLTFLRFTLSTQNNNGFSTALHAECSLQPSSFNL